MSGSWRSPIISIVWKGKLLYLMNSFRNVATFTRNARKITGFAWNLAKIFETWCFNTLFLNGTFWIFHLQLIHFWKLFQTLLFCQSEDKSYNSCWTNTDSLMNALLLSPKHHLRQSQIFHPSLALNNHTLSYPFGHNKNNCIAIWLIHFNAMMLIERKEWHS